MSVSALNVLACYSLVVVLCGGGCGREQAKDNDTEYVGPELAGMLAAANAAVAEGSYKQALAICDSVIRQAPGIAYSYFIRANALTAVNRLLEAKDALEKVLALRPHYPSIWFNLGNNAFRREKYREALSYYTNEWKQVSSNDPKEKKCAVLMQMGRAHKNLGEIAEAISAFEQVIKIDKRHVEVYNDLGHIYREEGKLEKALEYERQALELDPEKGEYHYYVGSLLYQLGEHEKAVSYLRTAVAKQPSYHGSYYNLGRALIALGRLDEGQYYLAQVDSLQQRAFQIGVYRFSAEVNSDRPKLWIALADMLYLDCRYEEALNAYLVAHYLEPENENTERAVKNLRKLMAEKK